jgi:hypothetical protein
MKLGLSILATVLAVFSAHALKSLVLPSSPPKPQILQSSNKPLLRADQMASKPVYINQTKGFRTTR